MNFMDITENGFAKKVMFKREFPELTAIQKARADKIRCLAEEKRLTQGAVAKALGITQPSVSRYWNGKIAWQDKHFAVLCELLGITMNELLIVRHECPIVADVQTKEGFKYSDITSGPKENYGMAPLPPYEEETNGLYCFKISFETSTGLIRPGTIIYARRGGGGINIADNGLAVYVDDTNMATLVQVKTVGGQIILKSLHPEGDEIIKPR